MKSVRQPPVAIDVGEIELAARLEQAVGAAQHCGLIHLRLITQLDTIASKLPGWSQARRASR
ncbi:MAG: hypothetical protein WA717_09735, partial [Methyloceanibacter sp.]